MSGESSLITEYINRFSVFIGVLDGNKAVIRGKVYLYPFELYWPKINIVRCA